jgi:protein ImuB
VRTVIAGAPDAARALARHGRIAIVPPGGDAAAVRPLPIAALGLAEEHRVAISRAGLKTIAMVADRPSMAFASRFGEKMTLRLRRVLGEEDAPLVPRRPVPMLWVERRFAEPIGRAQDVEATLGELGMEAATKLGARREGGRAFEAAFFRADGAVRRIAIETGRPMRDPGTLLRLFREKLDALVDPIDPGFGFDLIRLSVPVAEPLEAVQAGLDGRANEEDEVAGLADRLAARFGRDRVVRFIPENTHDPERAAWAAPAGFNPMTSMVWPDPEPEAPPLRPVQLFDPPQPVSASAEVPDGPPLQFTWRRMKHVVARAEGPERIAPEWWMKPADEPARDYYRIEDDRGRRFWLFRAGGYGEADAPRWYLHGLFA